MVEKRCPRCGITKPATEFYAHAETRDRLATNCKACCRARGVEMAKRRAAMAPPVEEKRCARCRAVKPVGAFGAVRAGSIARQNYCRDCMRDWHREHYGKSLEPSPRTRRDGPKPTEWRCARCRIVKPVEEFYKKEGAGKGFESRCKACYAEVDKSGRRKDTYKRSWRTTVKAKRALHREGIRAWYRAWYAKNPSIRICSNQRYAAKRRGLECSLTADQWMRAVAHFDGKCAYCGRQAPLVQEHFIPVSKDGPYAAANIVPACKPCNSSKNARSPEDWCSPEAYLKVHQYFRALAEEIATPG